MRFKTGIVVGAAAGYVLGARAGRERYEQIRRWVSSARKHPALAQLSDQAVGLVDAGRYAAAAGLSLGARSLRAIDGKLESE